MRRSMVAKVLAFFREGDPDEVKAVMTLMPEAIAGRKDAARINGVTTRTRRTRRTRVNGAEVHTGAQMAEAN